MTVLGKCSLCLETAELQLGHVMPKFVTKFMKKHSSTPQRLRGVEMTPLQDSQKRYMFCHPCEHLLAKDESTFRNRVMSEGSLSSPVVQYQDWLLRFAAGLLFRTIIDNRLEDSRNHSGPLERAEESLRDFMVSGTHTGHSVLHIGLGVQFPSRIVPASKRTVYEQFLASGCSWGIKRPGQGKTLAVYAHLPAHMFWMPVAPKRVRASEWQNVKIHRKGLLDTEQSQMCPPEFYGTLDSVIRELLPSSERAGWNVTA